MDTLKLLYEFSDEITTLDIEKIAQRIIDEGDAKSKGKLDLDGTCLLES